MTFKFVRDIIRPIIVPVLGFLVAAAVIITIGEILLHFYDHSIVDELRRRELWFGTLLAIAFLGLAAWIVTRPADEDKPGLLDREVVIGKEPMFK